MLKHRLLWSCIGFVMCLGHVTFTNLKCSFTNESFGQFEVCRIKAVNRTHKYISIHGKPNFILDNLTGKLRLLRYDNGYKLFFVDLNVDICKFLKNPQNIIVMTFYNTFRQTSNINHTCPYDHDIIVDKVWTGNLEDDFGRFLPIPNGDFAIHCIFFNNNVEFSKVIIYVRKS